MATLDAFSNSYLGILNKNQSDESDIDIKNKILKMELNVKLLETSEVVKQIYKAYDLKFANYEANQSEGRKRFLDEHLGGFKCGATMGDNKTLVTGGLDSVVRVFDIVQKIQLLLCMDIMILFNVLR